MESDFLSQAMAFWQMCTAIAAPIGAVAVALIGLQCLLGNARDMEKGMVRIRTILLAVVCLEMVPLVYRLVTALVRANEARGFRPWSPENYRGGAGRV